MTQPSLSRRERQIMDILYRRGRATGAEVMEDLPGDPSYSTVRTQLRVLERKGHVRHEDQSGKFIYLPAVPGGPRASRRSSTSSTPSSTARSRRSSARCSVARALRVTEAELDRIAAQVEKARNPRM